MKTTRIAARLMPDIKNKFYRVFKGATFRELIESVVNLASKNKEFKKLILDEIKESRKIT